MVMVTVNGNGNGNGTVMATVTVMEMVIKKSYNNIGGIICIYILKKARPFLICDNIFTIHKQSILLTPWTNTPA